MLFPQQRNCANDGSIWKLAQQKCDISILQRAFKEDAVWWNSSFREEGQQGQHCKNKWILIKLILL